MTFAELKAELVARGAENDATRNGRWLNQAYRAIANAQDWPFTEDEATGSTGAGTVEVANVRKVIVVGDVTHSANPPGRNLKRISFAELAEDIKVEDADHTGNPEFWWLDNSTSTITTWPLGGTIYVRYHKRLDPLSDDNDTPVFDEEYHPLIVDRAMVEVYKNSDEFEAATAALNQFYADLASMAKDYQVYAREHSYIQVVEPYDG